VHYLEILLVMRILIIIGPIVATPITHNTFAQLSGAKSTMECGRNTGECTWWEYEKATG